MLGWEHEECTSHRVHTEPRHDQKCTHCLKVDGTWGREGEGRGMGSGEREGEREGRVRGIGKRRGNLKGMQV